MMKGRYRLPLAAVVYLLSTATLWAAPNVVAPVLEQGAGGRSAAMAECYTAIAEGPFGHLFNPAGLAGISSTALGFQHESTGYETRHESLAGRFPLGPGGLGVLLNFFSYGSLDQRDENGTLTGASLEPADTVISLGYGMAFTPEWSFGINANMYSIDLGVSKFTGIVLDLGTKWNVHPDFDLAAVIKSMGGKNQGYAVPTAMRVGGAYYALENKLVLDAELDISLTDAPADFGLGAEYHFLDWLDGRIGFKTSLQQNNNASGTLVGGLGFNFGQFGLDLAFGTRGDIGSEVSGALIYQFQGKRYLLRKVKEDKVKESIERENDQIARLRQIREEGRVNQNVKPKKKKALSRIQSKSKNQATYHLEAGQEYEKYGQLIDAIIEYKAALKLKPNYKEARKALEAARKKARDQERKPVKKKIKTVKRDPSLQKLIRKYFEKGQAAYNQKDYAEAIEQLQLVLEMTSKHRQATALLSKAKTALKTEMAALRKQATRALANGDFPSEVDAYQKMLDLDPDNQAVKTKLNTAKKKIPKEVNRLYKQGLDYYAKQHFRKALKSFEGVLKLQPDHVKAKDAVDNIKEKLIQTGQ